ncbi:hypothetical protein L2E82_40170 [Cichorium intybus]|uniref:Uncharacterized protein n=1 Tax=Cichorium intybus TaxID=13427 RepID=A0ACB9AKC0_CICIN|nr:hypothetical protein L2E82_40170 [Cichorium intybus]
MNQTRTLFLRFKLFRWNQLSGEHSSMSSQRLLDIQFRFNPIETKIDDLDIEKLKMKIGEALAISSILQFHLFLTKSDHNTQNSPSISKNQDSASSCAISSTKLD